MRRYLSLLLLVPYVALLWVPISSLLVFIVHRGSGHER